VSGPRVRFAPSPTGSLHLGNARTALFNWLVARHEGGTFVLRIEDTDAVRDREGSEASILEDLRWLGLDWQEGPETEGNRGPYRQSERLPLYRRAANALIAERRAFPCFCAAAGETGREAAHHQGGASAGHRDPCRSIARDEAERRSASGEPAAIRFRVPDLDAYGAFTVKFDDRLHGSIEVPIAQVPDAVLLRDDGRPTYNFAVVVDDAAMGIDLVLRGDDHLSNTPLQVLLYQALDARLPEFAHVPMVLGPDGERLSKRHGATSVAAWRERGVPAAALVNGLALLGWAPSGDRTIVGVEDIASEFSLDRVGRSAAVFDPVKLEWISAQHIHAMPAGPLASAVHAELAHTGMIPAGDSPAARSWIARLSEFLRPSLARFGQVVEQTEPVFHPGGPLDDEAAAALGDPLAGPVLQAWDALLGAHRVEDVAGWNEARAAVQAETGAKGRALFQPIRVALTGRGHGRELEHVVPLVAAGSATFPGTVPSIHDRIVRTLAARP
jgi:glutamyl-tRNA synthetase